MSSGEEGGPISVSLGIEGLTAATRVGQGSFGVVYRAFQASYRRPVAVKVLTMPLLDDTGRRRFDSECKSLGSVSGHPNIVTLYSAGFNDHGHPYLLMEYLPGGSLAARCADAGPLPWEDTLSVGVKLAGALAAAHEAGILHRDLKPENVLFSAYGEPQLADFGVATIHGGRTTTTSSGGITGTLAHAAPEVISGMSATPASDVWSLASTLATVLLGYPPFHRDGDESLTPLITRILTQPPADLRAAGVPPAVCDALNAALVKDSWERPQTARDFAGGLQDAQRALGLTPTVLPAAPATLGLASGAAVSAVIDKPESQTLRRGATGASTAEVEVAEVELEGPVENRPGFAAGWRALWPWGGRGVSASSEDGVAATSTGISAVARRGSAWAARHRRAVAVALAMLLVATVGTVVASNVGGSERGDTSLAVRSRRPPAVSGLVPGTSSTLAGGAVSGSTDTVAASVAAPVGGAAGAAPTGSNAAGAGTSGSGGSSSASSGGLGRGAGSSTNGATGSGGGKTGAGTGGSGNGGGNTSSGGSSGGGSGGSTGTGGGQNSVGGPTPVVGDFFAVVTATGGIARGSAGVSSTRLAPGRYQVTFSQNISGCAAVANLGYVGAQEDYMFPAAVTVGPGSNSNSVTVDVLFPGNVPSPGGYPNAPVLQDNSFHLHVDCNTARFAVVNANGTVARSSSGVSTQRLAAGKYLVDLAAAVNRCAPVGTVDTAGGSPLAAQAYLALGANPDQIEVETANSHDDLIDEPFSLIVTCTESPTAVYPKSDGFYNRTAVARANACALTAGWLNTSPGSTPSGQGYVSTWYTDTNTAAVQTKNGGYGVQSGNGVDLVATC